MTYRIVPITKNLAERVRETLTSPQYKSLQAAVSVATGYGPCRSCLRTFEQGTDRRVYFTYNSFDGLSKLPAPGPVFIPYDECQPYSGDGFPPDLLDLPVLLEAFGRESRLISREEMNPRSVDEQIAATFNDSDVEFINLRNGEAGCFIARVDRV